jgi:hypothetical protein
MKPIPVFDLIDEVEGVVLQVQPETATIPLDSEFD